MLDIAEIKKLQHQIENYTFKYNNEDFLLCKSGIDLLYQAIDLLQETKFYFDIDQAARYLVWGYLGTIPSTALWCLDAASKGHYRISMILVRVLIEESITATFFCQHPKKAYETLKRASEDSHPSRVRYEPDIYKKFKAVGITPKDGLYRFYNEISERFSHSTSTMLPLKFDKKLHQIEINEPNFSEEAFHSIATYLLRLLTISMTVVIITFPELANKSSEWKEKANSYLDTVKVRVI